MKDVSRTLRPVQPNRKAHFMAIWDAIPSLNN